MQSSQALDHVIAWSRQSPHLNKWNATMCEPCPTPSNYQPSKRAQHDRPLRVSYVDTPVLRGAGQGGVIRFKPPTPPTWPTPPPASPCVTPGAWRTLLCLQFVKRRWMTDTSLLKHSCTIGWPLLRQECTRCSLSTRVGEIWAIPQRCHHTTLPASKQASWYGSLQSLQPSGPKYWCARVIRGQGNPCECLHCVQHVQPVKSFIL